MKQTISRFRTWKTLKLNNLLEVQHCNLLWFSIHIEPRNHERNFKFYQKFRKKIKRYLFLLFMIWIFICFYRYYSNKNIHQTLASVFPFEIKILTTLYPIIYEQILLKPLQKRVGVRGRGRNFTAPKTGHTLPSVGSTSCLRIHF